VAWLIDQDVLEKLKARTVGPAVAEG